MKRAYVETYGCQMNVADTELVLGLLVRDGYTITDSPEAADLILLNTCAVRDNAEQRVFGRIGELKGYKRPGVVLGVVGCMAQRLGAELMDQVPHIDLVIGPDGYRGLPDLIACASTGERVVETGFRDQENYEDIPQHRARSMKAFVTVQRGCDYRCTFCVVPMTRGRERSRKLVDVLREVEGLVSRGVTEVTLLGQTVNSYREGENDFADLLRAVGTVQGIKRVRFTSPYPTDFTERVVGAMAEVQTVCEHVHVPVQSGSSKILKRMGRRYDREGYLQCIEQLRAAIPGIAVTTDIIVGFPGETKADYADTESLVREVEFDDAFTFKYSKRDGTAALRLPDHVPEREKGERLEKIIATVKDITRRKNVALVGKQCEVLVEQEARRGRLLQTRTRTSKVVLVEGPAEWIGSYLDVRLTGTTGATFTGVPIGAEKESTIMG